MNLTRKQLRYLIREELRVILRETDISMFMRQFKTILETGFSGMIQVIELGIALGLDMSSVYKLIADEIDIDFPMEGLEYDYEGLEEFYHKLVEHFGDNKPIDSWYHNRNLRRFRKIKRRIKLLDQHHNGERHPHVHTTEQGKIALEAEKAGEQIIMSIADWLRESVETSNRDEDIDFKSLNENLMAWAEQSGVDFDTIQDIMLIPDGMEFLNTLREKKFRSIGNGAWQTKFNYKDSMGVQRHNPTTATLYVNIPSDGGEPIVRYYATQETGIMHDTPYEETFVGFDKLMNFLDIIPSDWSGMA